ncbi:penicillin-binding protein, 1A family [Pseudobutyrivibrio sp. OR37]|uniref:transglycosylase domain-containing protein n=1 Tax=Pseudobutyrivibrio sp. OR37 TaxID=1798186 RepID=UPI0008E53576|nr:PBP1A family penicillin-binding protein [Pseudobutyrivibrio sp. OR37]SFH93623.1 penicillin-binding protein, 1A family [Pseudobutyrivibrio sp. OR37]
MKSRDKKILRLIKIQIVLLLVVIGGVTYYYVSGYAAQVSELKTEANLLVRKSNQNTFRQTETSEVYDKKGDTISVLKGEKDVYYITYNEIPEDAIKALVSIEDKKFFEHNGVDYKAIARAAYVMIKDKELAQGGSTITMQLARTIFLSNEKTWQRKLEEIFIASELEKKYSKEQILEFYLNNVYFANGYYGMEAAAKGYFSKDISELDLAQICYLLAIPNSPTYYDPVVNPENTITRRNLILTAMKNDGVISEATYNKTKKETISLQRPDSIKNNYVETYVYYCATRALMAADGFEFKNDFKTDEEKGIYEKSYNDKYNECNQGLFTSGYRIYTSIDLDMQEELQNSIDKQLEEFTDVNEEGIYSLQSAGVCIDNETGMVNAIVGGRSQEVNGYTLNRAFQSFRQPGSSIKPLLVYTPALEMGYTPDTIVVDEKIEDGPENASGRYSGEITLRDAVSTSKNTIAWQLYTEITPDKGIDYLKALGFSHIGKEDYGMAACLGGFTVGVSPLEMAKGYATIYNDGYTREPTCILKIKDSVGNVIFEGNQEDVKVYEENAARNMTDMLQSVLTDGTARGTSLGDMPAAGKTGTTNDNRDGWFVGYSKYYTTSIWVGYDQPKKVPGLTGSSYPAAIWQDFMVKIHEGKLPAEFKKPVVVQDADEQEAGPEGEFGEFDQENPEVTDGEGTYQVITQTFEGTEVPEGVIPDNATDVQITTTTEPVVEE